MKEKVILEINKEDLMRMFEEASANPDKLLTHQEVMQELKIKRSQYSKLKKQGLIPIARPNQKKCILRSELLNSLTFDNYKNSTNTYLIKDYKSNLVKIGRTKDLTEREKSIKRKYPFSKMISYVNLDIEKLLHKEYAHKRIRGEWFDLSEIEVSLIIKNYKFKKVSVG